MFTDIGMEGNSWSRILKNGYEMKRVYEQNILRPHRLTKFVVEVTTDGSIKVFSAANPWIPLISVLGTPVQLKYLSFASTSRVQFFYDTDDEALLTVPVKQVSTENIMYVKHPLFEVVDYPVGAADLCKLTIFFAFELPSSASILLMDLITRILQKKFLFLFRFQEILQSDLN